MQKMRHFSGEVTLGSIAARKISYGLPDAVQMYGNITDMINQSIADFLSEDCGVDAAYEERDAGVKFLWINDIPLLYAQKYNSSSTDIYSPYTSTPVTASSIFTSTYSKGNYDFWLVFTGNPDAAFTVRYTAYSASQPTYTASAHLEIMKTSNILTKKDGMAWGAFTSGTASITAAQNRNYYCCDAGDDGLDWDSFSRNTVAGFLYSDWATNEPDIIPGQIPLVPFRIGPWGVPGTYQYPLGFDIVPAASNSSIAQNEMETGGRRFLVTSAAARGTPGNNYLSMPLVELTDE